MNIHYMWYTEFTYCSGYRQTAVNSPCAKPDHTASQSLDPQLLILQTHMMALVTWYVTIIPPFPAGSDSVQVINSLCCALKVIAPLL